MAFQMDSRILTCPSFQLRQEKFLKHLLKISWLLKHFDDPNKCNDLIDAYTSLFLGDPQWQQISTVIETPRASLRDQLLDVMNIVNLPHEYGWHRRQSNLWPFICISQLGGWMGVSFEISRDRPGIRPESVANPWGIPLAQHLGLYFDQYYHQRKSLLALKLENRFIFRRHLTLRTSHHTQNHGQQ